MDLKRMVAVLLMKIKYTPLVSAGAKGKKTGDPDCIPILFFSLLRWQFLFLQGIIPING